MREALRTAGLPSSNEDGQVIRSVVTKPATTDKPVRPVTRINGQRISFRDLAKFVWPNKTDKHLSYLTGYDERTCRRWLSNVSEPPAEALSVILCEIMRRFHER